MAQKLIQIFIPVYDNEGKNFPAEPYTQLQHVLTEKFKGVTIYQRAPAKGLWKEDQSSVVRDDLVIYEVVTETIDKDFWRKLKDDLIVQFRQDELMIRSSEIELI